MDETSFTDEVKVRSGGTDRKIFQSSSSKDCVHDNATEFSSGHLYGQQENDTSDEADIGSVNTFEEQGRPLMYPKSKTKSPASLTGSGKIRCKDIIQNLILCLIACGLLVMLGMAIVYYVRLNDGQLTIHKGENVSKKYLVGCSKIEVEDIWIRGFPKLMTESAFRLLDINTDGVKDILFGFATEDRRFMNIHRLTSFKFCHILGAEGYNTPDVVCDIYFSGVRPCLGGLLALDGASGEELWRHYSPHEVFSVNCNQDLDGDLLNDCIAAGRVGTFEAISSRDGHLLWSFSDSNARNEVMNLYTGQFVSDIDGDDIPDIVNIHGGDPFGEPGSATRLSGKVIIFSGRNGKVLTHHTVPDGKESYYSPVVYKRRDGVDLVLFGTGGETHSGSLWYIPLKDLYASGMEKAKKIYSGSVKGIMTPPVLIDMTSDGVDDIVFATYNSTILALDGETFQQLWNFTYPLSETYATPAPGYFNDDDVPDFMVHWQHGPGFPVYFHSVTTVVDGQSGKPLITPYIQSSVGAQTSPLSISVDGKGNDIFLYWNADCIDHEGEGGEFSFLKGTNVHEKSRSDFCRLRFKSRGISRMYAISSRTKSPGIVIYDSEMRKPLERKWVVDTVAEAKTFLKDHPDRLADYQNWIEQMAHHSHSNKETKDNSHHHESIYSDPVKSDKQRDDYLSDQVMSEPDSYKDDSIKGSDQGHVQEGDILYSIIDGRTDLNFKGGDTTGRKHRSTSQNFTDSNDLDESSSDVQSKNIPSESGNPSDLKEQSSKKRDRVYKRIRRHVGPHDEGGLQRLISTGTLAPPFTTATERSRTDSMDVVYATYWFYPAKTKVLLPEDSKCVEGRMLNQEERFDPQSKYFGMDDDGFENAVTEECLALSKHQLPENGHYQSQDHYTPYSIHMGQLTVYRQRLKCSCLNIDESREECSRILDFEKQQWSGYMGSTADSHWKPRKSSR